MSSEQTTGGVIGKIAGKVKEAAGTAVGNDELAREGRLQQAGSEAEVEARREAAKAEALEQEAERRGPQGRGRVRARAARQPDRRGGP